MDDEGRAPTVEEIWTNERLAARKSWQHPRRRPHASDAVPRVRLRGGARPLRQAERHPETEDVVSGPAEPQEARRIAEDGTQEQPEGTVDGGRSSYGPGTSTAGEQEPGGLVPPYEGRKESADPLREGDSHLGGVAVGGAAGMVADDRPKGKTVSGQTASPADEQPASEMTESAPDEGGTDLGSHIPGVRRGEQSPGDEAGRSDTGDHPSSGRPTGSSTGRDMTGIDPEDVISADSERAKG